MTLLEYFKALFVPTIDSMIADFTKTSERLKQLVGKHISAVVNHENEIKDLLELVQFHRAEANRAFKISDKIDQLVKV